MSVFVVSYRPYFYLLSCFPEVDMQEEGSNVDGTHMATQHNWRLLRRRQRNHLEIPRHITKTVGNITDYLSRESLITIRIRETESNAAARMRDHGPVPPIPTVWATVKRICSLRCFRGWVLIRKNVIRCPVNHKTAVFDPVCVAAWDTTEVRMLAVLRSSVFSTSKQPPLSLSP
jgi:hypothetical protein